MLGMQYTEVIQINESILVKRKGKEASQASHLHFGKSTQYSSPASFLHAAIKEILDEIPQITLTSYYIITFFK